jgi:hypothetical protein
MHEPDTAFRRGSRIVDPVVLALLLCTDVVFFALHTFNRLTGRDPLFSLATDGGYSEIFQYIKEYWIALVLFRVFWRTRERLYAAWALFFTYVLCDDALTIHERAGEALAVRWGYVPAFGLQPDDFGELTVSLLVGAVFVALIGVCHRRADTNARGVSGGLFVLVALLALFAMFFDMVHELLDDYGVRSLTLLEDGGEMVTMSVIVGYVLRVFRADGQVAGVARPDTSND